MGFGLLLIGYILSFVAELGLGTCLFAGMLIGGIIMFLGLCELRKYCPTFLYAIIAGTLFLICAVYETAAWADGTFELSLGLNSAYMQQIFDLLEAVIKLLFQLALLYGIVDLSRRVSYRETLEKAVRNMFFVVIFNICFVMSGFIKVDAFAVITSIFQLIYTVINAFLIFKCYAMICPEGEEDMHRKRSRFEFINKIRDKQDERDEQTIANTKAYFENKLKKKNEKSTGSNSNVGKKKK